MSTSHELIRFWQLKVNFTATSEYPAKNVLAVIQRCSSGRAAFLVLHMDIANLILSTWTTVQEPLV